MAVGDQTEARALALVMEQAGAEPQSCAVGSVKSMIGHTLSAAGAIEAVISLLTMQRSVIPPTINCDDQDPEIRMDVVPDRARSAQVRNVLSNSFGFGGQNVCVVLGRYESV